jgi:hypothetical protein
MASSCSHLLSDGAEVLSRVSMLCHNLHKGESMGMPLMPLR